MTTRGLAWRALACAALVSSLSAGAAETVTREQASAAMKKAATFFRTKVATHGGYVYYYAPDLSWRRGEGKATAQQIWVQPPGTPTVGLAFLKAYEATRDPLYLDGAREAAEALVYGQLTTGGWTYSIDFDPKGSNVAEYRGNRGRGRKVSSFDDGVTPAALRLLMHTDKALGFKHVQIHEAAEFGRTALLGAQFANGAFPQGWSGPLTVVPTGKAQYPDYDWHDGNRIKNYWDMPTLNDDLAVFEARALQDGWEIYKDERCRKALVKLGDFLVIAQMPEPQPAWAQQYDAKMRPIWARKFEPPAVAGRESLTSIETLLKIYRFTGDKKYLEPIPRALAYLRRSLLPDGRLSRYYELQTNKPLYMTKDYQLTHDDKDLPEHYGWKWDPRLGELEAALVAAKAGAPAPAEAAGPTVEQIVRELDTEGRWITTYSDQRLIGNPKFKPGDQFIASEVFSQNLETLSEFVRK